MTEAGGAWSFEAQPRIQTTYRAESHTISLAAIRLKVRRGVKLRLFMSQSQAGPGYLVGQSDFIGV